MDWSDRRSRAALLGTAVGVLARHGHALVVTSRVGGGELFELDGKPVREVDVLVRASVLDMTLLIVRREPSSTLSLPIAV